MEVLHQPYDSIMSMPCGRRRRLMDEKQHLDEYRANKAKVANGGKKK